MAAESELTGWNYFGYFTEIEEHFQRVRGTGLVSAFSSRLGADRNLEKLGDSARSSAARHRFGVREVACEKNQRLARSTR